MNLSEPVKTDAMSIPCSLKLLSDELLVERAKAGDTSAFVELRARHSTKVLRTLYRITKSWEDSEDAFQESLLKAFRHLNDFENRCSFSSWLTRIAINSALMIRRKHKNGYEVTGEPEKNDLLLMSVPDPRPDPLNMLRVKQEYEVLRHAIDSLPSLLREGLQIRLNDDLSLKEIATRLHLSLPATKTRLLRAKRLVIAEATARLMPTICANGKTQDVAPVS